MIKSTVGKSHEDFDNDLHSYGVVLNPQHIVLISPILQYNLCRVDE